MTTTPVLPSLTDEQIDNCLPLGMAQFSTLCGPLEIRAYARAIESLSRAPAEPAGDDSWGANAKYLLDRCRYTVRQRPGGGPEDLMATLVVTFQGMQMRLDGHPLFKPGTESAGPAPAEIEADAMSKAM